MDGMGEKPAGVGYKQYADPSSIYRAHIYIHTHMGNPEDLFRIHVYLYRCLFTTKKTFFFKRISHAGYGGRGRPRFSIEHACLRCLYSLLLGGFYPNTIRGRKPSCTRWNIYLMPTNSGIFTNWLARFRNHQEYYKRSFWVNITWISMIHAALNHHPKNLATSSGMY